MYKRQGMPPIVLTSPVVRIYFKRLTEQIMPELIVLSYNELDSKAEIQSVGEMCIRDSFEFSIVIGYPSYKSFCKKCPGVLYLSFFTIDYYPI